MTPGEMGIFQPVHLDRKDYDQPLDAASQALVETVLQACAECKKREFLAQELADRREVAWELVHSVGGAC